MVMPKLRRYNMAARALLGLVAAFEQAFHVGAVFVENFTVIRFRKRRFAEPPNIFNGVFNPLTSHRNPFGGRRQFRGIMPKTLLREMKADLFAQHQKDFEMIK